MQLRQNNSIVLRPACRQEQDIVTTTITEDMYQLTAFLCGHFHRNNDVTEEQLHSDNWTLRLYTDDEKHSLNRIFYSEFVDFFTEQCRILSMSVDTTLQVSFRDNLYTYRIDEISVYQMPLGMTLFSVRVKMTVADLNDVTAVLSSLRMIDSYAQGANKDFADVVLMPVKRFYDIVADNPKADLSALVENGNKLKLFQVINETKEDGTEGMLHYVNRDLLLYQLGSVARVTTDIDVFSPSDIYLENVLQESRISIFRNWQALALMDTFTIIAEDAPAWLVDNWTESYFRQIYLHALFEKSFLFRLNKLLRTVISESRSSFSRFLVALGVRNSDISLLLGEFKEYDQKCRFHKVSYNFLPLEINSAIDKGLCVSEELELMDVAIEKEKQRRDEANDKMVNTLLFLLSALTLGSAIWDLSCLLDQMFPYADYLGSSILGYRTVVLVVLVVLAVIVSRLFRKKE